MSAATVEDAILDDWAGFATLDNLVPGDKTFIGEVPLLDQFEIDEVTPPYVSVREDSIVRTIRTNESAQFIEAIVSIEVQNESRESARAISDAIRARFNRKELTWDKGAVMDMRPQVRRESDVVNQDGMWVVTWLFLVRYSQTS